MILLENKYGIAENNPVGVIKEILYVSEKKVKTEAPEGMKLLITTSDNFEADILNHILNHLAYRL